MSPPAAPRQTPAATWLVVGLLLAGTIGCTHQAPTPPSTPTTATTPPATTARTQRNGLARRLHLAAGPAAAQFAIHAPAPPSHTFTVRILAPRHADLAVWLQTWYGQRLDVLGSTHDRASCRTAVDQTVCLLDHTLARPRHEHDHLDGRDTRRQTQAAVVTMDHDRGAEIATSEGKLYLASSSTASRAVASAGRWPSTCAPSSSSTRWRWRSGSAARPSDWSTTPIGAVSTCR